MYDSSEEVLIRVKTINRETVIKTLSDIISENEIYYGEYRELLTRQQWNLLTAIAKEEGASQITSGNFIKKYDLSNNATVRRGIQSLLEKQLIYKRENRFYLQDVFLEKRLQTL